MKRIKKTVAMLALSVIMLVAVGCSTHIHTIGDGPQSQQMESARQWFILFGLVPLNTIDAAAMAGGASDFEIKTQATAIDVLIGIPASWITVSSRTVTVTK